MNDALSIPAASRILVIDDNPAIHDDFRKILAPELFSTHDALVKDEALLFGGAVGREAASMVNYQMNSALQGQEGLRLVEQAALEGRPYALAFVDVRMPPGWDGVETIGRIWQKFPDLQIVICTAYSDYSWFKMMASLGRPDNLVVLKKPFDPIEVLQLAHSLTSKWRLAQEVRAHIRDLDEQVQSRTRHLQEANTALRNSEDRFAKAFRASPIPLTLQDIHGQRYVDVNDNFLQVTGFERADILGHTPGELKLFPKPETAREILGALSIQQHVHNRQDELRTRDGKILTVLMSAETFELENRPHFLTAIQDISERLNLEEQLRQAQKMEAVGQIAAGVAHDFNNMLTVIQGHAELQLSVETLDQSLRDSLNEISRAAGRAASLTHQLLAFSRKQMLQCRPLDVNASLKNLESLLHRLLGETISLQIECAVNLSPVMADAINFEQVIINLAVNARDAMPRGGPLTIAAELVTIDSSYLARVPDARLGTFVQLSITDKGFGMDETVRGKIFEPFFTTKEVGKGTGMGLATVYGIVKQHQGWIEVESVPGAGSAFKIFLPVTGEPLIMAPQSKTTLLQAGPTSARTIFVVEDETSLREMASIILKRLGYQVVVASDGQEALSLWTKHRGKIDLLLTDMVMPGGMTGRELADRILREEPKMPVIYSSGYSVDLFNSGVNLVEGVNCLLKPYNASALASTVQKAFAAAV